MRRLAFVLPLIVFAVIAGYFLFGLDRDPGALPSALVGKPVPAFDLPPLAGREQAGDGLAAADLTGDGIKLVNFFASWCVPCRAEHPLVTRLSEMEGLRVVGINYKDDPEDAAGWLRQLGDPYGAVGADRDGRVGIEWGIYGVPETFVIDGEGIVRMRHAGPLTPDILEDEVLPLIEELRR